MAETLPEMSKEDAVRKIVELTNQAKDMHARYGKLEGKVDEMAKDLVTAQRALGEQRPSLTAALNYGNSEGDLGRYLVDDPDAKNGADGIYRNASGAVQMSTHIADDGDVVRGLLDDTPTCDWQAQFQTLVEQRTWLALGLKPKDKTKSLLGDTSRADKAIRRHIARAPGQYKRIFADASGVGAEWVPDLMLPNLERTLTMPRVIEALFMAVQAPGKEIILPFLTTSLRPFKKVGATIDNPGQFSLSSPTTAQRTITIPAFACRTQLDADAAADSIINAIPLMTEEIVRSLDDGFEDCAINGDTAATHQDTGLTAWNIRSRWGTSGLGLSDDHRRTFIGLRGRAIDVSCTTDGGSAQTYAGFMASMLAMDTPHHVNGDVVVILSPEYYLNKLVQFTEHLTVDKFGPDAFNVKGFVSQIAGKPIFLSEFVDKQYNASGVYDDTTKTKTGFIIVNRQRFKVYRLAANTVETDKDITRGVIDLVATTRRGLFSVDPTTSVKNVNWTYNLTPS